VTDCTGALANGGFESGLAGWTASKAAGQSTPTITTSTPHGGSASALIYGGATVSQTIPTVVGASYSVTFYSYQFGSNGVFLTVNGNFVAGSQGSNGNGQWFQRSGTFVAAASSTTLLFTAKTAFSFTNVQLDDVVVAQSPQ
jgi:hypothetical protein